MSIVPPRPLFARCLPVAILVGLLLSPPLTPLGLPLNSHLPPPLINRPRLLLNNHLLPPLISPPKRWWGWVFDNVRDRVRSPKHHQNPLQNPPQSPPQSPPQRPL